MLAGLDFGTSNSALGIAHSDQIKLLPLFDEHLYLPSTLYCFDRYFISEYIDQHIHLSEKPHYQQQAHNQIQRAKNLRQQEGISHQEPCLFFGEQAIEHYIESPEEGTFIKSPKSFLGSTGLSTVQIQFFEDLVSAMMLNIKRISEQQTEQPIDKLVIGRPVNYQGIDNKKSNQQAIAIMTQAGKRCGYKEIEFLYEPIAAGIDFETKLTTDKIVLVVDIGGGTTDCSMVKMGPSYRAKDDRSDDFLAHTGQRIGGNDLDILLAHSCLMPLFGRFSQQKKGLEVPHGPFWTAAAINDAGEQSSFASLQYINRLKSLRREVKQPELIDRLIYLQQSKQNHRLIRSAELSKIALSDAQQVSVELDYIEPDLSQIITQQSFESAVSKPLLQIQQLIQQAIQQAGCKPEVVYITGGSAKSPTVRKCINQLLPNVDILDGDYYGSVATGLTKWAAKIWR